MTRILLVICGLLAAGSLQAQLDRLKKQFQEKMAQAAPEKLAQATLELADDLQARQLMQDTSAFNYAISAGDNSLLFGSQSLWSAISGGLMSQLADEPSRMQQALELNRQGAMAYRFRQYTVAELRFLEAFVLLGADNRKEAANEMLIKSLSKKAGSARTELLTEEAMAKIEQSGLPQDEWSVYTQTLANLGLLYHTQGRFVLSEQLSLRAFQLRQKRQGETSLATAASANNLASLYKDLGRYQEAEEISHLALQLHEESAGEEQQVLRLAIVQNNHAMLLLELGRYDQALEYVENAVNYAQKVSDGRARAVFMSNKALILQEKGAWPAAEQLYEELAKLDLLAKRSPERANLLTNHAALLIQTKRLPEAQKRLEEAADIYEKQYGDQHPAYASALVSLARFHRYVGQGPEAVKLLQQAADIRKAQLGEKHPDYVQLVQEQAILDWEGLHTAKAIEKFRFVRQQQQAQLTGLFPAMSEHEKAKFWARLRPSYALFASFVVTHHHKHPELLTELYDIQLRTKGMLLNSLTQVRQSIMASNDPALKADYLRWTDQKQQLAYVYTLSKEEAIRLQINVDSLEKAANQTERSLSVRSEAFAKALSGQAPAYAQVAARLGAEEAAVEMLAFPFFKHNWTGQTYYAALIAKPGTTAPELVLFENGKELEGKYYKYYRNAIYQQIEDEDSYAHFWQKADEKLKGRRTVYLAPDGVYSQINLHTLLKPGGRYVLDDIRLRILGSTRDLLKAQTTDKPSNQTVLFGFPEYGQRGEVKALPGTKAEVEAISKMLIAAGRPAITYAGPKASETNLKNVSSPAVLHIATHGFFLEDVRQAQSGKLFGVEMNKAAENPLLRAGLLMAGAEQALDQKQTRELRNEDNGILTAYEAMNMNLHQTELVVLSACETGLGDVQAGEGVYGLQRAFQAAGAESLLMSLWQVSDEATQLLMQEFYTRWVKSSDKHQAFAEAQAALKKKYAHPYFWGAFVLVD